MAFRAFAVACLFAAAAINSAFAQSDNNAPRDPDRMQAVQESNNKSLEDYVVKYLNELRGGAVILDMHFPSCSGPQVQVARETRDGKLARVDITTSHWFLGKQNTPYIMITTLPPGNYEVLGAVCSDGRNHRVLNGPFAKFQVKLGEVVNVGALKLDYKSTDILFGSSGTLKKSIESLTPEALADLAKKYPTVSAKTVERRMEMIGAAEANMKQQPTSIGKLLFGIAAPR